MIESLESVTSRAIAPPAHAAGLVVLKIGGRACDGPAALDELVTELGTLAGAPLLIVHGGGAEVTDWCRWLGLPQRFVRGRRVTDDATLEVATAVLAGLANKRLVALLRAAGADAVGLSALDGGMLEVVPRKDAESLGHVGRIRSVDPSLPGLLLEHGRVPVVASIGASAGRLLNVNADDVAAAFAASLGARALILLGDAPGLVLDGEVVPRLDAGEVEATFHHPDVHGGMVAKLEAARTAVMGGVSRVAIAAWQGAGTVSGLMTGAGVATWIERNASRAVSNEEASVHD